MDKRETIERLVKESYEKGGFNGTWLYAENGEIVSKGALGFSDTEDSVPVREDSIFQLASVSKQFTTAAVMLAFRQGLMDPDDRITKFFPELTAYDGATVRNLLNHTSGIPDYFEDLDWFLKKWKEEKRIPGNGEIVDFICGSKLEPSFAPGEKYEYSNTGYNLLALLVEKLSGVPYEEFLQKNIFDPAGMSSTHACHIRRDGVPFEGLARATVPEDGRWVFDIDSRDYADIVNSVDGLNGDDYVFTNIFDLFAWDRALREGKVLTADEQRIMYTPGKLNSGENAMYYEEEGMSYGFGWAVVNDEENGLVVSHSGGMPGVATWFERFIDRDRVLIILNNREALDMRASDSGWEAVRDIAFGREPRQVISVEDIAVKDPDRSKWESFCGKYEHPEDTDLIVDEVYKKDGELWIRTVDEDGIWNDWMLYPLGEDKFGRKGGMIELTFGEGSVTYLKKTCKKLQG
ncbi:MAG: beta-lactamase family protein [Oscillospiraceae bacterium]|nr:beta-lactamase family protein [Oscillospiraceae bacterium]MBR4798291.1 beta-lactamase family protein [Oscillospiraceae bacterium]